MVIWRFKQGSAGHLAYYTLLADMYLAVIIYRGDLPGSKIYRSASQRGGPTLPSAKFIKILNPSPALGGSSLRKYHYSNIAK